MPFTSSLARSLGYFNTFMPCCNAARTGPSKALPVNVKARTPIVTTVLVSKSDQVWWMERCFLTCFGFFSWHRYYNVTSINTHLVGGFNTSKNIQVTLNHFTKLPVKEKMLKQNHLAFVRGNLAKLVSFLPNSWLKSFNPPWCGDLFSIFEGRLWSKICGGNFWGK